MILNKPRILQVDTFKSRRQEMFTMDMDWQLRDTKYRSSFLVLHYDYKNTWLNIGKNLRREVCEMMCWDSLNNSDDKWGDITYNNTSTVTAVIEWHLRFGRAEEYA